MIYISGPGHGGNFLLAQSFLEGTFSECYPDYPKNKEGLKKYLRSFLTPMVQVLMQHQKCQDPYMKAANLVTA